MTSTLIKYNVILIVLCIGITLIHNSSEATVKIENLKQDSTKEVNLYYDPFNPQCRSVLLTLGALDLELNLKRIYLFHSEQLPEDFRNINSLHTLPVMQDGDLVLSESNAIIVHLVRKYGGQDDHPLYPNNPKIQAKVNQGLHFNNSYFSQAFEIPHIFRGILKTAEVEDKIHEALNFLEEILEKSTWTAGNTITVADFALVASISTFEVVDFNLGNYQQIQNWLSKCKTTMASYDTANQEGIYELKSLLESKNGFQNKIKTEISLYYDPISPSCRSVLLTIKALNLEVNLKVIDLLADGTQEKDFLDINSLHTLPVMQDGELVLVESHAIIVYLVQVYGKKNDPLYPHDPTFQAQINQRLDFNNFYFYLAFEIQHDDKDDGRIPKIVGMDKIHKALKFLEEILKKSIWTAGNIMTVADFALVASISTFEAFDVDLGKYENIKNWLSLCKSVMPNYDWANQEGIYAVMAIR
ncbi:uncharacterized protein LOC100168923 isoform X2 [Acyrthosiphon pisum]|uniref:Uncharacterized protein n=1 Tax=Acyrthosiphon pisum TaxID=7029 RepID=A0A8R2JR42_ACYPI|nr:uncharacterized protein LOC100168923 isoform X2 [Acyrthosiphon pisum]